MTTELVCVPVPGADDLMATEFNGNQWAALKPMCETLGIDYSAQLKRLKGRSWAVMAVTTMTAGDGKNYQTTVIDRSTIPMWLATIDERRVADDARSQLVAYQREAAAALDAYFNQRAAAPAMNQLDVLRAALDQIEAAQRDAADAKAIAQRTDDRLAAIEGRHDWLSALAYARINGLPTHTTYLKRLGGCAGRIGRSRGIAPNPVQHQLYGEVNSWPVWVWDLAADGFSA
ncbi:putative prophage antirepressor [Mycolicibacterium canariasense]|uniref:Putative prophage antirepressor n=1 Tax=Mycolicibacterium canariasense TaxID=228230 RepID=A0A100WCJ8_MYCCR|nr:phage antirepressor N-terminal domain-containing protein [Mycolicibacterium canariasense]MCV7212621.1 phage antirepressor [Mycolicibacterium canariasense]ORV02538.1 phage antirepressor [Mycolicibacterium canariasense]GAS95518.1 putative prophage antirepressor [Mycolicibacterium canariasense]